MGNAINIAAAVPARIMRKAAGFISALRCAPFMTIPTPTATKANIIPMILDLSMAFSFLSKITLYKFDKL
jgi:hypothetical protein